jgi:ketosteroid isomerase-like protein
MGGEHVELVRRGLAAFNARDADSFAALVTADFVWMPSLSGAVGLGGYAGRAGIDRYFAESRDTWLSLAVEGEEVIELSGGAVLMLGRAVGRGVGSGAPVAMPLAFVAEFRDGRIAHVETFLSHEEGRAAAARRG